MKSWNILATYNLQSEETKKYVMQHLQNKELCKCDDCGRDKNVNHDALIAMIHGKFGKGNVILTGIHPEIDWRLLDNDDAYLRQIIEILRQKRNHQKRLQLLQRMFGIFDMNTRNISKL